VPAVPHTGNRLYARISNCRVNPLAGGTRWPCGNEIMPCWMVMSDRLANGQEGRGAGITDELVIVCHRGASPGRSLDLERCINHRGSSETWRRAYREGSDRRHTRSVRAKTAALGRPSGADFGPTQDEDALLTHSDRRHPQGGAGGSAGKRKQPGGRIS
jgi:hypothetical protein